jgi:NADH dehydrogenase
MSIESTPGIESTTRIHVVVVGGGYAGTLAANRLRQRPDVDITLVNARPVFVERIRLHQLVAGTGAATAEYGTLLGDGIRLLVDNADRIDAGARRIQLASGTQLDYDHLIYAVGSSAPKPAQMSAGVVSKVPGAAEFAHSVADLESAQRLRDALPDREAPIVVIGGGLTGIEAASELAEQGRPVTLLCGGALGPSLGERGRRSVAKLLLGLGVNVLESATAGEVRHDAVVLTDGAVLPSAATVWTAGFSVPDLAARSGLSTDAMGRLLTDETLTSVDDERIVAAGDAAAPSGRPLRMSCQAAEPMGAQAANTVLSHIAGTAPAVLNQAFAGQCISLGRTHGALQLARPDDTPVGLVVGGTLGGRAAAAIKEAVCKGTLWAIRREAAKPGSYYWLKGGKRTAPAAEKKAAEQVTAP